MINNLAIPLVIVYSLILASCGSGGGSNGGDDEGIVYTGSKSPASVDAGNAGDLAVAATGGANQAIAADAANSANPISPRGPAAGSGLVSKLVGWFETTAATGSRSAQQSIPICDAGSADLDQNTNGTEGTIEFTNCLVSGGNGEIVNGRVSFTSTLSGTTITSLVMRFINFRVSYLDENHTVNMTVSCAGTPLVCSLFSDFVGVDGRIYRVEISIVANTGGSSFDVDATVFDPQHGYFTLDASVNYNNCPGGVPETGTATITGSAATTASIVFNDCAGFTVTHLGVPTDYFWADIL